MKNAVLQTLAQITGLEVAELEENMTINVFENGLLDSLSLASLLTDLSKKLGKELTLKGHTAEDFATIEAIIETVSKA